MEGLRRQRGTAKAKLTRLERKITGKQSEIQLVREQIEVYVSRLEEIRSEFDEVHKKIVAIQDNETASDDEIEDEEFENRYLSLKIQLKQIIKNIPIAP